MGAKKLTLRARNAAFRRIMKFKYKNVCMGTPNDDIALCVEFINLNSKKKDILIQQGNCYDRVEYIDIILYFDNFEGPGKAMNPY